MIQELLKIKHYDIEEIQSREKTSKLVKIAEGLPNTHP